MSKTVDSLRGRIERLEKEEIIKALKESGWVMSRAAKQLGITERMIGYKVNKYGIRIKEVRWNTDVEESEQDGSEKKELE